MPPIGKKTKESVVSPFDNIEAPSTSMLDNNRLREEIFHLERTIGTQNSYNQSLINSVDDLCNSTYKLTEAIEELVDLLKEKAKKDAKDSGGEKNSTKRK